MSKERDPDEHPHLDDEPDRGDVSREGFNDYDKEAHPKRVDIDPKEPGLEDRERTSADSLAGQQPDTRYRFEVHFRMMKLRI